MNVQPRVPMDKDALLAQGREGRFELVERHVVMMVGGSNACAHRQPAHARIVDAIDVKVAVLARLR
jgi:hypothetical protein